jgi:putative ABC transport system permease protein
MFLLRLSLRNLWRNPRRTLLSLVVVVAGVAVLIMGQGVIGGTKENMIRAQIDGVSSHVVIRQKDYPSEGLVHPTEGAFAVEPALVARLDQAEVWTTRTVFVPRAVHGPDALRVRGIAYDPERDPKVFPRDEWKVNGDLPTAGKAEVLVGTGTARLLRVKVGDEIMLEARTLDGAINALSVRISGVVRTGQPIVDTLGVLIPLPLAQDLIRSGERSTHVMVRLASRDAADAFLAGLEPLLGEGREAVTWLTEVQPLLDLQRIRQRALNLLVLALMGMSATGIANTVLMAAFERIREVGTLRAMGMTRRGVVSMFLVEGMFMGLAGAVVGGVLGGAVVAYYARVGIDLTASLEASGNANNLPVSAMLYFEFSWTVIVGAVAFGTLIAVLASIYPALVASKMPPAEAVRAS